MNIDRLIGKIYKTVENHRLSEGVYARWMWQNEQGTRKLGINEYGCADAANILYTIGAFPRDPEKRIKWVEALRQVTHSHPKKCHLTLKLTLKLTTD